MNAAHETLVARLRTELAVVRPDLAADAPAGAGFKTDLEMDSLDLLEFVARVEVACRTTVPDEDWQQVTSLDALADYLVRSGVVVPA